MTLAAAAAEKLAAAFGPGVAPVTGEAPGRCTLAGEHVDYAGGMVAALAVDLAVAVAVRPGGRGRWRAVSGGRRSERAGPQPCGDWADRAFAVVVALQAAGVEVGPVDLAVAATLPEAAGLSSSAALACATAVALLRLVGARLPASVLAEVALVAERDVCGVPCGPLDQRVVVGNPAGGALLLDFAPDGVDRPVAWRLRGVELALCHTGETHDVGGQGYRTRRAEADEALAALGAASWRAVDGAQVAAAVGLDERLRRRARHIVGETARAVAAADAVAAGDGARLGGVMTESGRSLREDCEVTTPALDAAVAAALAVPGCLGARMVGAGFGGSAVALVAFDMADRCAAAMGEAVGGGRTWLLRPAPGVAVTAADVVTG